MIVIVRDCIGSLLRLTAKAKKGAIPIFANAGPEGNMTRVVFKN